MSSIQGVKYIWRLPKISRESLASCKHTFSLSLPVLQALHHRGFKSQQEVESFLFSSRERDVAHPSLLKDASKAVERIVYALKHQEKILIAGDYDVDGITSSALMLLCLLPLGARVNFFLPNRARDGYGLSVKTIQKAAQSGYSVVITVDNGITAFEAAREAKKLGIDLIITDHHRPHEQVPEAFAVIDPYQEDCLYPYKKFAGVGVSFKLITLLYEQLNKEIPTKVYELLLLGTVADVVPLTGENRFWVRHGLEKIQERESFALTVLKTNARITKPLLTSTDIGFFITPQINALGRLEDPRDGVKFLLSSEFEETERIGQVLKELNEIRKDIERSIVAEIEKQIEEGAIRVEDGVIIAASNTWPTGVIGLVASRLVSKYNRPTLLFHLTDEGIAKGSCRSIPEFNLFNALHNSRDLLISFGGHSVAAGLSLKAENIPTLKVRLEQELKTLLTAEDLCPKLSIDAELMLEEANRKLLSDLAYLEPFGCENPCPVLYIKGAVIREKPTLLKGLHVRFSIFSEGII
ncbi:MAG TPA: single-stranded-DNA-specific exonuclease RecJ, partial [Candidatus Babeliaceae bacterium]|nr:single-stranded-DNA-specific exonuclease RecJ [Candidatus Babeliaceae bacterium]